MAKYKYDIHNANLERYECSFSFLYEMLSGENDTSATTSLSQPCTVHSSDDDDDDDAHNHHGKHFGDGKSHMQEIRVLHCQR